MFSVLALALESNALADGSWMQLVPFALARCWCDLIAAAGIPDLLLVLVVLLLVLVSFLVLLLVLVVVMGDCRRDVEVEVEGECEGEVVVEEEGQVMMPPPPPPPTSTMSGGAANVVLSTAGIDRSIVVSSVGGRVGVDCST